MKLICLIASHIDSINRLKYFKYLINSIEKQTRQLDDLYISLSCNEKIRKQIIKYIISLRNKHGWKIFIQNKQTKQFKHYEFLSMKIPETNDIWLMFSDDDDIWSEERTKLYYNQIVKMEKNNFINLNYKNGNKVYIIENLNSCCDTNRNNDTSQLKVPKDILNEINKGNINHVLIDNKQLKNYINYCINSLIFLNFFKSINEKILYNSLCDVRFSTYMSNISFYSNQKISKVSICEYEDFMYYWRCDDNYNGICNPHDVINLHKQCIRNIDLLLMKGIKTRNELIKELNSNISHSKEEMKYVLKYINNNFDKKIELFRIKKIPL